MHRSLLGFLAGALAGLVVACGCGGPTDFAHISFGPSTVTAVRTPATCNTASPPYASNDTFALTVVGEAAAKPNTLTITLHDLADVTDEVPLTVPMSSTSQAPTVQTADSTQPNVSFSFARGSNATEIDDGMLTSVLVTVVSVPKADGEDLGVHLVLNFADGSELEDTYSAKVTTSACQ